MITNDVSGGLGKKRKLTVLRHYHDKHLKVLKKNKNDQGGRLSAGDSKRVTLWRVDVRESLQCWRDDEKIKQNSAGIAAYTIPVGYTNYATSLWNRTSCWGDGQIYSRL